MESDPCPVGADYANNTKQILDIHLPTITLSFATSEPELKAPETSPASDKVRDQSSGDLQSVLAGRALTMFRPLALFMAFNIIIQVNKTTKCEALCFLTFLPSFRPVHHPFILWRLKLKVFFPNMKSFKHDMTMHVCERIHLDLSVYNKHSYIIHLTGRLGPPKNRIDRTRSEYEDWM